MAEKESLLNQAGFMTLSHGLLHVWCDVLGQTHTYCELMKMMAAISFMMITTQRWLLFDFYQSVCLHLKRKLISSHPDQSQTKRKS